MSRRVTKKQPAGTIDVDTFKSWLQGVEDMQGADWCPTLEQWRKIRQKIDMLEADEAPAPGYNVQTPTYPIYPSTPIPRVDGGQLGGPTRPLLNPAPPPSSLDTKPSDINVGPDGNFNSSFV